MARNNIGRDKKLYYLYIYICRKLNLKTKNFGKIRGKWGPYRLLIGQNPTFCLCPQTVQSFGLPYESYIINGPLF